MGTKQVHRIGFTQLSPEECVADKYLVKYVMVLANLTRIGTSANG